MHSKTKRIMKFWLAGLIPVLFFGSACAAALDESMTRSREKMVAEQIERRGVKDERVLEAVRKVERHLFVPAALQPFAYSDRPLPIGHGQTISQPYIVAFMTEAARIQPTDRVLEIGTGSGYQAAILGEVAQEVYTIELLKPLADNARYLLAKLGYDNVRVKHGDGYQGWPEFAPYDSIVVTAAPPEVPKELLKQLKIGGRMIIPVGSGYQKLYRITKTPKGWEEEALLPVLFVPMVHPSE